MLLALSVPTAGSSCAETSCEASEDCPVGQVCARGRICAPRQCGFVVDGSIGDSCDPGYSCVEGVCQIGSSDYLDAAGTSEGGPQPAQDTGAPVAPVDSGVAVDSGAPEQGTDTGPVAPVGDAG